jgi:tetratricopeptide (TPR) repeat protein
MFVGMTLDMLGRPHEALAWQEAASQLAATPGEADSSIGDCWTKLGDDEQAERAYKRATELRPGSHYGILGLARLRLLQGNIEAARELCRTLRPDNAESGDITAQVEFFGRRFGAAKELYAKLESGTPGGGGSFYGAVSFRSALGRSKQALGEEADARGLLEDCLARQRAIAEREPENPEAAYRLAAVEASLGMTEASFVHLRRAVARGWTDYRSLSLDPRFDLLRGPEFQTIIDELSAKVADMRSKVSIHR